MRAYYEGEGVTLFLGDCVDVMKTLDAESVDAIVTDPPYGLEFMGVAWDTLDKGGPRTDATFDVPGSREHPRTADAQARVRRKANANMERFHYTWAVEALRVLKPGGHMVAFGGTRTHHRLWCAVEDAGFEVRDSLMWLYGSGFPKSLDVSKSIDKAAGAKREVVIGKRHRNIKPFDEEAGWNPNPTTGDHEYTAPATDAARQWQSWGTALKPAWEPILLARKPIERTVAANVQKHGTGALNIGATRIEGSRGNGVWGSHQEDCQSAFNASPDNPEYCTAQHPSGRWPANLVLDEEAAAMLDAQGGESSSAARLSTRPRGEAWRKLEGRSDRLGEVEAQDNYGDSGGASRFFYTSKAGPDERGGTKHPTVKPRDLMLWLCKLITPPGGLILDPFIGSGTTAVAAIMGGFRCIGIDNNEEYLSHAAERLRLGDEGLCVVNEARKQGSEQMTLFHDSGPAGPEGGQR